MYVESSRIACKSVEICYARPSRSWTGFTAMQTGRLMQYKTRNCPARWRPSGRRQMIGCLIAWFLSPGMAGQGATPDSNLVSDDFENVDLRVFIKFVSEETVRIFLLSDRVLGEI